MKKALSLFAVIALLLFSFVGCSRNQTQNRDNLITLSIWHVYGGQVDSPLNDVIDEFNQTVGKDQGIQVEVTMVSNTNNIHKDVIASASGDPGAATLPDLFVSYPKTVLSMPDDSVLVDFQDYFSEEELAAFIPQFLKEGKIHDRQLILPLAKSTEILYVNKTIFDRFAAETGAKLEDLSTWEGLYQMACEYAIWSDAKTPEVANDPKHFFVHDYHFNYFQVGAESLGYDFFEGDTVSFSPAFDKIWEPYAKAALSGGLWLQSGYATEPLRTGDAVASVASSASILYYSDVVTYPDNTSEEVEIISLPCPVFAEGNRLVMQRGAGICLVKSTKEREQAAITFLKWLTEPERNTQFVTQVGYMPVTKEAFEKYLPGAIEGLHDPKYISLYKAFLKTYEDYTFYNAPLLDTYLSLETIFEQNIRLCLLDARKKYIEQGANPETMTAFSEKALRDFCSFFQ